MQNFGGFTTPTPVAIGTQGNPNWGSVFLGDLVTKVNFGSYVREAVYGNCRWVQSGIIQRNTALDMSSGGTAEVNGVNCWDATTRKGRPISSQADLQVGRFND